MTMLIGEKANQRMTDRLRKKNPLVLPFLTEAPQRNAILKSEFRVNRKLIL
jgi:hypothetical protein